MDSSADEKLPVGGTPLFHRPMECMANSHQPCVQSNTLQLECVQLLELHKTIDIHLPVHLFFLR
jgi:hypothetical protein